MLISFPFNSLLDKKFRVPTLKAEDFSRLSSFTSPDHQTDQIGINLIAAHPIIWFHQQMFHYTFCFYSSNDMHEQIRCCAANGRWTSQQWLWPSLISQRYAWRIIHHGSTGILWPCIRHCKPINPCWVLSKTSQDSRSGIVDQDFN